MVSLGERRKEDRDDVRHTVVEPAPVPAEPPVVVVVVVEATELKVVAAEVPDSLEEDEPGALEVGTTDDEPAALGALLEPADGAEDAGADEVAPPPVLLAGGVVLVGAAVEAADEEDDEEPPPGWRAGPTAGCLPDSGVVDRPQAVAAGFSEDP